METSTLADSNVTGDNAGDVVPSVDDMITGAISEGGTHNGKHSLDTLHFHIEGMEPQQPQPVREQTPQITYGDTPRKRGRPRGSVNAPAEPRPATRKKAELATELESVKSELAAERARNAAGRVDSLAQTMELCFVLAFGAVAESRGPHWKMEGTEAKACGKSGAHALAPYLEEHAQHAPWLLFAATLGGCIGKRVMIDRSNVKKLAAETAAP